MACYRALNGHLVADGECILLYFQGYKTEQCDRNPTEPPLVLMNYRADVGLQIRLSYTIGISRTVKLLVNLKTVIDIQSRI